MRVTRLPVHAFDLICQNRTCYGQTARKRDFKRKTFDLVGDGAAQGQANLYIVSCRGDDKCWTPPRLFMACLRVDFIQTTSPRVGNKAIAATRLPYRLLALC